MCFRINNVCYIIFTYVRMCKLWNRSIHVTSEAICKYPPLIKGFWEVWEYILCGPGSCVTVQLQLQHVSAAFEVCTFIEEIDNTVFRWQNTSSAAWHFPASFSILLFLCHYCCTAKGSIQCHLICGSFSATLRQMSKLIYETAVFKENGLHREYWRFNACFSSKTQLIFFPNSFWSKDCLYIYYLFRIFLLYQLTDSNQVHYF